MSDQSKPKSEVKASLLSDDELLKVLLKAINPSTQEQSSSASSTPAVKPSLHYVFNSYAAQSTLLVAAIFQKQEAVAKVAELSSTFTSQGLATIAVHCRMAYEQPLRPLSPFYDGHYYVIELSGSPITDTFGYFVDNARKITAADKSDTQQVEKELANIKRRWQKSCEEIREILCIIPKKALFKKIPQEPLDYFLDSTVNPAVLRSKNTFNTAEIATIVCKGVIKKIGDKAIQISVVGEDASHYLVLSGADIPPHFHRYLNNELLQKDSGGALEKQVKSDDKVIINVAELEFIAEQICQPVDGVALNYRVTSGLPEKNECYLESQSLTFDDIGKIQSHLAPKLGSFGIFIKVNPLQEDKLALVLYGPGLTQNVITAVKEARMKSYDRLLIAILTQHQKTILDGSSYFWDQASPEDIIVIKFFDQTQVNIDMHWQSLRQLYPIIGNGGAISIYKKELADGKFLIVLSGKVISQGFGEYVNEQRKLQKNQPDPVLFQKFLEVHTAEKERIKERRENLETSLYRTVYKKISSSNNAITYVWDPVTLCLKTNKLSLGLVRAVSEFLAETLKPIGLATVVVANSGNESSYTIKIFGKKIQEFMQANDIPKDMPVVSAAVVADAKEVVKNLLTEPLEYEARLANGLYYLYTQHFPAGKVDKVVAAIAECVHRVGGIEVRVEPMSNSETFQVVLAGPAITTEVVEMLSQQKSEPPAEQKKFTLEKQQPQRMISGTAAFFDGGEKKQVARPRTQSDSDKRAARRTSPEINIAGHYTFLAGFFCIPIPTNSASTLSYKWNEVSHCAQSPMLDTDTALQVRDTLVAKMETGGSMIQGITVHMVDVAGGSIIRLSGLHIHESSVAYLQRPTSPPAESKRSQTPMPRPGQGGGKGKRTVSASHSRAIGGTPLPRSQSTVSGQAPLSDEQRQRLDKLFGQPKR